MRIIGGKKAESYYNLEEKIIDNPIYKEHEKRYLAECIENLRKKVLNYKIGKRFSKCEIVQ